MKFQVTRKIVSVEYGTVEADSHAQAADMLRAGMWGDVVSPVRDKETVRYAVNGVPVGLSAVEYEDMTDEQKRIVDAGDEIAGTFPQGMTREQRSAWMRERFGY